MGAAAMTTTVATAMATTVGIRGVRVGLDRPLVLLAVPVALLVVAYLLVRGTGATRRNRLLLFGTRLVVVVLVVTAAAGPFTVTARETPGDPQVTMLVDESASTAVAPSRADELAEEIEAAGVPVSTRVIASGNRSRIGDAIVSSSRDNGSVLVVSDGRVTGGRSLAQAAEFARGLNATVYAVSPSPTEPEAHVRLEGPRTTSIGTRNRFVAHVDGVNIEGREHGVTVTVDGETVNSTTVTGGGSIVIPRTFEETGTHRITVRLGSDDRFEANDVYYRTVRVVERPKVLYVARGDHPFARLLNETHDLDRAQRIPSAEELDPYQAVVLQNMPAAAVGNLSGLQRYVIDGGGLVVVGGPDAYENGGYESSPLSVMLPVRNGTSQRSARIMLTIDISGSAQSGLDTQKALALDVIDQLGDQNQVGIIAFNDQPFLISEPRQLGESRAVLKNRIRRLKSGGSTRIAAGLIGSGRMLEQGGTVILLSDGRDRGGGAPQAADRLRQQGTRVISIGVGKEINADLLRTIAERSDGGTYFRADEANRLRLLFGDESRQFQGSALTVVDSTHFITRGVSLTASPGKTHSVKVKPGADFLVAGGSNDPAVASWDYGLGRTVSVTAYAPDGTLDGLLSAPDSLILTRSVNWAIGDPSRGRTGVVDIDPTRVGEPTTITYVGESRPSANATGIRFVRTGEERFEARLVPSKAGYASVLDRAYAVNYPRELASFGRSPALVRAVEATDGRVFEAGQAAAIADAVTRQHRQVRTVREDWGWVFLAAALVVYLLEVMARRLSRVVGRASRVAIPR